MPTLENSAAMGELIQLWNLAHSVELRWAMVAKRCKELEDQAIAAANEPADWTSAEGAEHFQAYAEDLALLADIARRRGVYSRPGPGDLFVNGKHSIEVRAVSESHVVCDLQRAFTWSQFFAVVEGWAHVPGGAL